MRLARMDSVGWPPKKNSGLRPTLPSTSITTGIAERRYKKTGKLIKLSALARAYPITWLNFTQCQGHLTSNHSLSLDKRALVRCFQISLLDVYLPWLGWRGELSTWTLTGTVAESFPPSREVGSQFMAKQDRGKRAKRARESYRKRLPFSPSIKRMPCAIQQIPFFSALHVPWSGLFFRRKRKKIEASDSEVDLWMTKKELRVGGLGNQRIQSISAFWTLCPTRTDHFSYISSLSLAFEKGNQTKSSFFF